MPSDQMIGADPDGTTRPMRECTREHNGMEIGCGAVDDHPRHVLDTGNGDEIQVHIDCHAAAGCVSCRQQIADRPDGATGQEMLDHLLAQAPTPAEHEES